MIYDEVFRNIFIWNRVLLFFQTSYVKKFQLRFWCMSRATCNRFLFDLDPSGLCRKGLRIFTHNLLVAHVIVNNLIPKIKFLLYTMGLNSKPWWRSGYPQQVITNFIKVICLSISMNSHSIIAKLWNWKGYSLSYPHVWQCRLLNTEIAWCQCNWQGPNMEHYFLPTKGPSVILIPFYLYWTHGSYISTMQVEVTRVPIVPLEVQTLRSPPSILCMHVVFMYHCVVFCYFKQATVVVNRQCWPQILVPMVICLKQCHKYTTPEHKSKYAIIFQW